MEPGAALEVEDAVGEVEGQMSVHSHNGSQGISSNNLVGSKDRQTILLQGSGHIGLAIGGRAQKEVWPQACRWLAERSG